MDTKPLEANTLFEAKKSGSNVEKSFVSTDIYQTRKHPVIPGTPKKVGLTLKRFSTLKTMKINFKLFFLANICLKKSLKT